MEGALIRSEAASLRPEDTPKITTLFQTPQNDVLFPPISS
jgi:hypothetical protein